MHHPKSIEWKESRDVDENANHTDNEKMKKVKRWWAAVIRTGIPV